MKTLSVLSIILVVCSTLLLNSCGIKTMLKPTTIEYVADYDCNNYDSRSYSHYGIKLVYEMPIDK